MSSNNETHSPDYLSGVWKFLKVIFVVGVLAYLASGPYAHFYWRMPVKPAQQNERYDVEQAIQSRFASQTGQIAGMIANGQSREAARIHAVETLRAEGDKRLFADPRLALQNCGEKIALPDGFMLDLRACPKGQDIKLPLQGEDAYSELDYRVELLAEFGEGSNVRQVVVPDVPVVKTAPGAKQSRAVRKSGTTWTLKGDMWYTYNAEATHLRVVKK